MVTQDELIELLGTDLTHFFHDNFMTADHLGTAVTQTGVVTVKQNNLLLSTGIQANSRASAYYLSNVFNPLYSTLQMKVRLSSMKDVVFWIGFHEDSPASFDPSAPLLGKSFLGFRVRNGFIETISGNEHDQKAIQISNVDLSNHFLLKIEGYNCWTRPLPQIYPYFDGIRIVKTTRNWQLASSHGGCPPENMYHYITFMVINTVGTDKICEIGHITLGEEYAD